MAYGEFHYFSSALGKAATCNIFFPEETDVPGPYPVYYLLHGLSDDYSAWQRRTSIERYVQALPLIVVMPDGGRGWYSNAHEGYKYEDAIIRDCIGFVDRTFHTDARREARAIGGLSMGGYGAIKLALQHPDLFVSANGHSGAYGFGHAQWRNEESEFRRIVGPQGSGGPLDLWKIAADSAPENRPALRIDCGTSDFLHRSQSRVQRALERFEHCPRIRRVPRRSRLGVLGQARSKRAAFSRAPSGHFQTARARVTSQTEL